MITAFSREGPKKVYVQHRLRERAQEVNELLEKKAYLYVCGDAANMAREVNTVLAQIIAEKRGIPETKAEEIVKNMRASNQYQVSYAPNQPAPLSISRLAITLFTSTYRQYLCALINSNGFNRRTFGHKGRLHMAACYFLMHGRVSVADRLCIEEMRCWPCLESRRCGLFIGAAWTMAQSRFGYPICGLMQSSACSLRI